MRMPKLADAVSMGIALAMCGFGVWAFVANPMIYMALGHYLYAGQIIPVLAAFVAAFALRPFAGRSISTTDR